MKLFLTLAKLLDKINSQLLWTLFSSPCSFSSIHVFFVDELCDISRTKTCHEAELKKKESHLQWERENERRRMRKEELEKELQRQVLINMGEKY